MPAPTHLPVAAGLCLALLMGACNTVAPPNAAQLPLQRAWFEGRAVLYVTTDASDAEVAAAKGANFVPRLKNLLPKAGVPGASHLERVYTFVNAKQPTVFPSVPHASGAARTDAAYTPLWRMVHVAWLPGRSARELKSEEQILQAQEQGDLALTVTDVVLNCPVLAVGDGPALRGTRFVHQDPATAAP